MQPKSDTISPSIGCAAMPVIPKTNAPTLWLGLPSPKVAKNRHFLSLKALRAKRREPRRADWPFAGMGESRDGSPKLTP